MQISIQNTELERLLLNLLVQRFDNDWDKLSVFLLHLLQKELSKKRLPQSVHSFEDFTSRWKGFLKPTNTDWKTDRMNYLERKHQ